MLGHMRAAGVVQTRPQTLPAPGWSWYSISSFLHIHSHVGDPITWGSRILVLAYGVWALRLLTACLCSNASAC